MQPLLSQLHCLYCTGPPVRHDMISELQNKPLFTTVLSSIHHARTNTAMRLKLLASGGSSKWGGVLVSFSTQAGSLILLLLTGKVWQLQPTFSFSSAAGGRGESPRHPAVQEIIWVGKGRHSMAIQISLIPSALMLLLPYCCSAGWLQIAMSTILNRISRSWRCSER